MTVKENLSLLDENKLQELSIYNSCRSHLGGWGHQQLAVSDLGGIFAVNLTRLNVRGVQWINMDCSL